MGHLSHAATVIRQGRPFLRDLFQLLSVARQPHHFVWLTRGAKADILWWLYFLKRWNGRSFFPRGVQSVHVYTYASGSFGCGDFQQTGHWFKLAQPCDLHRSFAALELIPVVVAATLWGDNWQGKLVCFHSDNKAVVSVLNKGHAQDVALTHLMWCLAFLAAFHGFHFSSVHVPGRLNEAADALSRNNLTLFHSFLPQALLESIIPPVSSSAAGIGSSGLGLSHLDKVVQFLLGQGVASSTTSEAGDVLQAIPAPASPTNGDYFMSLCGFFSYHIAGNFRGQ